MIAMELFARLRRRLKPNVFGNGGSVGARNTPERKLCNQLGIVCVWGLNYFLFLRTDLETGFEPRFLISCFTEPLLRLSAGVSGSAQSADLNSGCPSPICLILLAARISLS